MNLIGNIGPNTFNRSTTDGPGQPQSAQIGYKPATRSFSGPVNAGRMQGLFRGTHANHIGVSYSATLTGTSATAQGRAAFKR